MAIEIVSFPITNGDFWFSIVFCMFTRPGNQAGYRFFLTRVVSAQKPSFQGIDPSSHQGPNELLAPWWGIGKAWENMAIDVCSHIYFVGLGKWNHISLSWILRPWMGMIPHMKTTISHIICIYIYGKCVIILWNGNFWIWQIRENSPSQLPNKLRKISC